MKKLALLFASFLVVTSSISAKEVATYVPEAPVLGQPVTQSPVAPVATPAENSAVSEKATEKKESSKKDVKLTTSQKMALKMMKKPLKKATSEAGVSGDVRTGIIVSAIGLILMILGMVFWPFWFIGAIVLVIGLVLLLLALI